MKRKLKTVPPPETYDVEILVRDGSGVYELGIKMPGIKRSDIMAPDYEAKHVIEQAMPIEK